MTMKLVLISLAILLVTSKKAVIEDDDFEDQSDLSHQE